MQTVRVTVRDAEGRAIDEAQISVDGGMPQHGHGLPTRPRVTRNLGDGIYEIEGVRLRPLRLRPVELRQLEAFLQTLSKSVIVGGPAAAKSTQ